MNARLLLRLTTVGLTAALLAPVAHAQVPSGRLRRPARPSSVLPSGATRPATADRITAAQLDRNTQLYWRFDITGSGDRVRTEVTRWRGRIEAEDPRRLGPPRRVDFPLGDRGDWVMAFYVDREQRVLAQPILDRWGRLVGVVGAHPSGVYVSIDIDRDGSADIFNTHRVTGGTEPELSDVQTLFATDEGLNHLRNHIASGRALACGRSWQELESAAASSQEVFGATAASLGTCAGGGGRGAASGGGGSRFGNVHTLANRRMTETTWNRLCARYGSGTTDGGRRAAGGNGKNPREFHWSDALTAAGRALNPIPTDADAMQGRAADSEGMNALEELLGFGVGWAVTATKAAKAFIEGGRGDFVNEADRELYHFERQAEGTDARPDPAKVDDACSAGSTSSYCGEACASGGTQSWCTSGGETEVEADDTNADTASPPPDTEPDTGGGEGDGAGQPVENDPTDISATCEARREAQWRRRSFTNDTRYVREQCSDPRERRAPSRMSAGGVQMSTYCGSAPETTAPNLSEVIGARGCPPTASPGPGGRCSVSAGTPRTPRGRLSYGALDAVGLEMRLRPCPDATCNPAR